MRSLAWLLHPEAETEHGRAGLALLLLGELMILVRVRPLSDLYFPVIWLGYILFMDAAVYAQTGASPFVRARKLFLVSFALSAVFWWTFELLNTDVQNWIYIGGGAYTGLPFAVIASIDFSIVLPAVWVSALFICALLPGREPQMLRQTSVPSRLLWLELSAGIVCLTLPLVFPRYAYGLIWGCAFLLLDPLNHALGRPSMIGAVWRGRWRPPVSFALGALMCGFFWEAWNYWSLPRWIYNIPYVGFAHIFEMPLLGWSGYLPFGLELFAMANFALWLLRLPPLTLDVPAERETASRKSKAS